MELRFHVPAHPLLADVDDGFGEVDRPTTWDGDYRALAAAYLAGEAHPGWEPLSVCRDRVVAAVAPVLAAHAGEDVVLVGHGTAWTVLAAELTGRPPDLERWASLAMPAVIRVDPV